MRENAIPEKKESYQVWIKLFQGECMIKYEFKTHFCMKNSDVPGLRCLRGFIFGKLTGIT